MTKKVLQLWSLVVVGGKVVAGCICTGLDLGSRLRLVFKYVFDRSIDQPFNRFRIRKEK